MGIQYISYPKAKDELVPGTWKGYHTPKGMSILVMDYAGHILSLDDHNIGEVGLVQPSVVCPEENCTFHQWLCLEGFEDAGE